MQVHSYSRNDRGQQTPQTSRTREPVAAEEAGGGSPGRESVSPALPVRQSLPGVRVVDRPDGSGNARLLRAAQKGRTGEVRMLIERGASPHLPGQDGRTALMEAAQRGHQEVLAELVCRSGINLRDRQGSTALALAARFGQVKAIALLLRHGALIDLEDVRQRTPLMLAAASNRGKAVRLLLRRGADVDALSDRSWSAASYAAGRGHASVLLQLLKAAAERDAGLRAHRRGRAARTLRYELSSHLSGEPRQKLLAHDLGIAIEHGQVRTAQLLVDSGARLKTRLAASALEVAVQRGQPAWLPVLLSAVQSGRQRKSLIDRQFGIALKTGASSAIVDLLAQQRRPFDVDDCDETIIAKHATLIPDLASRILELARQPGTQPSWRPVISWLCARRGVRHLVAQSWLNDLPPPQDLFRQLGEILPDTPGQSLRQHQHALCVAMLVGSGTPKRLCVDWRSVLDRYADAPTAGRRLGWQRAGPLAAQARAQAELLTRLAKDYVCESFSL